MLLKKYSIVLFSKFPIVASNLQPDRLFTNNSAALPTMKEGIEIRDRDS